MALRQGINVGRSLGGGSLDGIQRSDYRMVQGQLNRVGRHLDPVTNVQGTARYPMRIGKPNTVVTPGAYLLTPSGGAITFVGDYFDRLTGVYASPQGATTPPLSCVVTDEQHLTVTFDVCSAFGQVDIYFYDNYGLWPNGNAIFAFDFVRAIRIQPLEQQGATLCYRAPHFTIAGGTCTWFSSERANGNTGINNYPATVSAASGPTMSSDVGGAPIFNSSTAPLTNADLMATWLDNGGSPGWYLQAVVDLTNITSTTAYRALEAIISDSLGSFALGFYSNAGTWTVAVTARVSSAGYLAQAALPSNAAQRVIVQAKMDTAGKLWIRLNGGAWIGGNTLPSTTLDTGGSVQIGQNFTTGHFQGTIWFLATYGSVPADSTFCDLMYALHNVNYPPTPIKLLDLDSRFLTTSGGTVTTWLDQSGNGWNATLTSGATAPSYQAAFSSKDAPNGYNGQPGVVYTPGQLQCHETSDTIATSIGKSPITIFLVGNVDQSLSTSPPSGNQYFVMTKGGAPAGIFSSGAVSWGAYAGTSAPNTGPSSLPNRRSITCAVFTQGDTQRMYCNSKLPVTYGSPDSVTNTSYVTGNLALALGALDITFGGSQGETNRTLRGGGWLQTGITTGFRIGNYQSPSSSYSPSGVILRVIVYLGALTQDQVESVLSTLETTYGVLIEDEIANEAGLALTGAWDPGPEINFFTDPNFNNTTQWLGKSTRAFTLGENFKALSGDAATYPQINGKNVLPNGNHRYDQVETFTAAIRVIGAVFQRDGQAGSMIVAFVANSAAAPGGVSYQDPAIICDDASQIAVEFTTSGLKFICATQIVGPIAAATATNQIVLIKWDGTNIYIAVNASGGNITWTSVAAPGPSYLSGHLLLGVNFDGTKNFDGKIAAVRTYRHALTDSQFNTEAVPIQNNLAWSNGFTTSTPYSKGVTESLTASFDSVSRVSPKTRAIADNTGFAPTDSAARLAVMMRAITESFLSPSDAVVRALVEMRAVGESASAPTDAAARSALNTLRGIGENDSAPTDAVVRGALNTLRAVGETQAASSDTAARADVLARAVGEIANAPTDSAARSALNTLRAIAESESAVTDSAARAALLLRAVGETDLAPSDSAARALVLFRGIGESKAAPTDAAARGSLSTSRSITETETTGDQAARMVGAIRAVVETLTASSDSAARMFVAFRAVTETEAAATDAAARMVAWARAVGESPNAPTDSPSRMAPSLRAVTESSAAPTDAAARALVELRAIGESMLVPTDAAARSVPTMRAIGESESAVTDAAARMSVVLRAVGESAASPTDALTRALVELRAIAESMLIPTDAASRAVVELRAIGESKSAPTDAASRSAVVLRAVGENKAAPSDALTRALVEMRAVAEAMLIPTDSAARAPTPFGRAVAENDVAPSDAVARVVVLARAVNETDLAPSDAASRLFVGFRPVTETPNAPTDSATHSGPAGRSITESSTAPTDAMARLVVALRAIGETALAPFDSAARLVMATRAAAESLAVVTDAAARMVATMRAASESTTLPTDAVARALAWARAGTESIAIPTDAAARQGALTRLYPETPGAPSDDAERDSAPIGRNLNESLAIPTDAAARQGALTRAMAETLAAMTDALARLVAAQRLDAETIAAPTDAAARLHPVSRAAAESLTKAADSAARTAVYARALADGALAPSDAATRRVVQARGIPEAPGIPTDSPSRAGTGARAVNESQSAPTDAAARTLVENRSAAESVVAVAMATVRMTIEARALAEALSAVTDSPARRDIAKRTGAFSVTKVADAAARAVVEMRAVSETSTISDALAQAVVAARLYLEEIDGPDDDAENVVIAQRAYPETARASDAVARQDDLIRTIALSVSAPNDAVTQSRQRGRAPIENVQAPTEIASPVVLVARALTESTPKPADAASKVYLRQPKNVFESTLVLDQNRRHLDAYRHPNEIVTAPFDGLTWRRTTAARRMAEIVYALDSRARTAGYRRLWSDGPGAPSDVATPFVAPRSRGIIEAAISTSDAAARLVAAQRLVTEVKGAADAVARFRAAQRALAESTTAAATYARVRAAARGIGETAPALDSASRGRNGAATITEALTLTAAAARHMVYGRALSAVMSAPDVTAVARATSTARAVAEWTRITDAITRPRGSARGLAESIAMPSDAISLAVVVWADVSGPARILYTIQPMASLTFGAVLPTARIFVGKPRPAFTITFASPSQAGRRMGLMSHLGVFDVGDTVEIPFQVLRTRDGFAGDPSSINVKTLVQQSGVTDSFDFGGSETRIVKDSVSNYRLLIPIRAMTDVGDWIVQVTTQGGLDAMQPVLFSVRAPLIPIS